MEFFNEIRKIIGKRWIKINASLHLAAYALNAKWYMERPNKFAPIDDEEVKHGFHEPICKIYTPNEENVTQEKFIDFSTLNPSKFS